MNDTTEHQHEFSEVEDTNCFICERTADAIVRALRKENERLRDWESGLRYVRRVYGELPGVGWERLDAAKGEVTS